MKKKPKKDENLKIPKMNLNTNNARVQLNCLFYYYRDESMQRRQENSLWYTNSECCNLSFLGAPKEGDTYKTHWGPGRCLSSLQSSSSCITKLSLSVYRASIISETKRKLHLQSRLHLFKMKREILCLLICLGEFQSFTLTP